MGVLSTPSNDGLSVTVDLSSYFNNVGVSASPGDADFDGHNGSYPVNQLPTGILVYRGVNVSFILKLMKSFDRRSLVQFTLPPWDSSSADNVLAQGQIINLTPGRFHSLHLFGAGDGGSIYTNNLSVTYSDGTVVSQPILIPGWKSGRVSSNSLIIIIIV